MRKMKKTDSTVYSGMKIRTRIAFFLTVFTLIPILCIFLVSAAGVYRMNYEFAKNHIESGQKAAEYNLEKYVNRINISYISILSNDSFFINLEDVYAAKGSVEDLNVALRNIVTEYIGDIDIIAPDGAYYQCLSENKLGRLNGVQIKKCMNEDNNWEEMIADEQGNYYFILSKKLVNVFNGNNDGVIIFYVPEKDICNTFSNIETGKDSAYLLNGSNRMISGYHKEQIGSLVLNEQIPEDKLINVSFGQEDYYISRHRMKSETFDFPQNFILVETISREYVDRILRTMFGYLIAAFLTVIILAPVIAVLLSRKAIDTVTALQKRMVKFSDGEDVESKVRNNNGDEIAMLENNFDDMVVRIKELINKNNLEKEKQRVAELNALQAQINPHFIYNTLDSISWLAQRNGEQDIVEIVQALSGFFRISLHNGERYVTVAQELEHVKSYLTVEEFRYPDEFEVRFDVEEALTQEPILKIILQPIVENSIKHGIRPLETKGVIDIKVYSEGEYIMFEIRDNGIGFDVSNPPVSRHNGGYGLKNVASRIQMEYGNDCGVQIRSKPDKGTVVLVKIRRKIE